MYARQQATYNCIQLKMAELSEEQENVRCHLRAAFSVQYNFRSLFDRTTTDAHAPLDGIRALAVLWVCAFHAQLYLAIGGGLGANQLDTAGVLPSLIHIPVMIAGDLGVDMFFCLSGFLIADMIVRDMIRKRLSFSGFIIRRYWRIAPVYMTVVALYAALFGIESCRRYWWTNALFVNNIFGPLLQPEFGSTMAGCVEQSWSIAVQFQFYFLSPSVLMFLLSANSVEWRQFFGLAEIDGSESGHVPLLDGSTDLENITTSTTTKESKRNTTLSDDEALLVRLQDKKLWKLAIAFSLCFASSLLQIYVQTSMRFTPYICGMMCCLAYREWRAHGVRATQCALNGPEHVVVENDNVSEVYNESDEFVMAERWRLFRHAVVGACLFGCAYQSAGTRQAFEIYPAPLNIYTVDVLTSYFFIRPLFGLCVCYFMLQTLTGRARRLAAMLSWNGFIQLARLSFAIYLLQLVALILLQQIRFDNSWLSVSAEWSSVRAFLALVAYTSATVGLSTCFAMVGYLLIEKPSMNLRK